MESAQEAIPNDLTPLGEASVLACLRVTGPTSQFTLAVLNLYAQALSRLVTIYVCSENGKQIRALASGDLKGGKFRDGGREVTFADGRAKLTRLAVRLTELHRAIEALKRNAPPSEE